MAARFSGSTETGQPEKNRSHIFRLSRKKTGHEKNGVFQPEPPEKFQVEPGKSGTWKDPSFSTGSTRKISG